MQELLLILPAMLGKGEGLQFSISQIGNQRHGKVNDLLACLISHEASSRAIIGHEPQCNAAYVHLSKVRGKQLLSEL